MKHHLPLAAILLCPSFVTLALRLSYSETSEAWL